MTVGAVSLLMGNFTTVPGISFISFPFAEILRVKRSPFLSIATFTMSSGLILFLSTKSGASSTEIPSFSKTILFGGNVGSNGEKEFMGLYPLIGIYFKHILYTRT